MLIRQKTIKNLFDVLFMTHLDTYNVDRKIKEEVNKMKNERSKLKLFKALRAFFCIALALTFITALGIVGSGDITAVDTAKLIGSLAICALMLLFFFYGATLFDEAVVGTEEKLTHKAKIIELPKRARRRAM